MSPRLPHPDADIQAELEIIAYERHRANEKPWINQDCRLNFLASLDEWEADLRRQLAETAAP